MIEVRAEIGADTAEECPCSLCQLAYLSYFSYTAPDHLPRDSAAHSGCDFPKSIGKLDSPPHTGRYDQGRFC